MANPATSSCISLAFLLFLFQFLEAAQGATAGVSGRGGGAGRSPAAGYVPVPAVVYRSVALPLPAAATTASADEAPAPPGDGGGYQPFELCMGCRCCPSASSSAAAGSTNDASSCVDTQCCYAIDCNIPGKPFGVCAFSPRTCGCGGAGAGNNCTTQQP